MKTAIVYDRVNKWGGAERVLLTLHEMFPDAPLYTSVYNPSTASWAKVFPEVIPSFLQKIPFAKDNHEHFPYLMPLAFELFNFDKYDLVLSVTSEAAKGIITKPGTLHICYCLTPTRYLWSHYDTYFKGQAFKGVTKPFVAYLRYWDKIAAQRPDAIIAISTEVQRRIQKYYNRDSEIIYPPVEIEKFQNSLPAQAGKSPKLQAIKKLKVKNYYLVVSRLVPYKKVDLAVETFNELGYPLVIVGTGSEESKLKSRSKRNIIFKGLVSDGELIDLYRNTKGLIFPQEEDFGIVAVEAQAAGCPVIAYRKGGAIDTVIEGKTGIFFEQETKESLIKAIKRFERFNFSLKILTQNSERFSKERFKKEFMDLLDKS